MRAGVNHRQTVLLVEDVEDSRYMMRRRLEMSGYGVVEAANGREAVERARRACPDLILMDLSLPELDGLSATKHIRELEELYDVPIVAVSAHDTGDFYAAARAAGCCEYVKKPVDFDRLLTVMGRYCPTAVESAACAE